MKSCPIFLCCIHYLFRKGFRLTWFRDLRTKEDLVTMCTMIMFTASVKHAALNNLQFEYACFPPCSVYTMRGNPPTEAHRGFITEKYILDSLPDFSLCIKAADVTAKSVHVSDEGVFLLLKEPAADEEESESVGGIKKMLSFKKRPRTFIRSLTNATTEDDESEDEDKDSDDEIEKVPGDSDLLPPRWLFTEEEVDMVFKNYQSKLQKLEDEIEERNKNLEIPYCVLLPSRIPFGLSI